MTFASGSKVSLDVTKTALFALGLTGLDFNGSEDGYESRTGGKSWLKLRHPGISIFWVASPGKSPTAAVLLETEGLFEDTGGAQASNHPSALSSF
jgi:hypothetical protein